MTGMVRPSWGEIFLTRSVFFSSFFLFLWGNSLLPCFFLILSFSLLWENSLLPQETELGGATPLFQGPKWPRTSLTDEMLAGRSG
jgi:hypothetical protein